MYGEDRAMIHIARDRVRVSSCLVARRPREIYALVSEDSEGPGAVCSLMRSVVDGLKQL